MKASKNLQEAIIGSLSGRARARITACDACAIEPHILNLYAALSYKVAMIASNGLKQNIYAEELITTVVTLKDFFE